MDKHKMYDWLYEKSLTIENLSILASLCKNPNNVPEHLVKFFAQFTKLRDDLLPKQQEILEEYFTYYNRIPVAIDGIVPDRRTSVTIIDLLVIFRKNPFSLRNKILFDICCV